VLRQRNSKRSIWRAKNTSPDRRLEGVRIRKRAMLILKIH